MAADEVTAAPVLRIHGAPEDWLREFVEKRLGEFAGRIQGVCVHLEVTDEEDPDDSFTAVYQNWPQRKQLIGALTITIHQLAGNFVEDVQS